MTENPDNPNLQAEFDKTREEHNNPPIIYKCPGCKCIFLTEHDLQLHKKTFGEKNHEDEFKYRHKRLEYMAEEREQKQPAQPGWFKSKFGGGEELKHVRNDPELARKISANGTLVMGCYRYQIKGDWIVKSPMEM